MTVSGLGGILYPKPRSGGFANWRSLRTDVIDINSSFYGPPQPSASRNWDARVADHSEFRFAAKLWKGFTHERNANASNEKVLQRRN
jgi:uncharacterized protein YecE (DUF72 family)